MRKKSKKPASDDPSYSSTLTTFSEILLGRPDLSDEERHDPTGSGRPRLTIQVSQSFQTFSG